MINSLVLTAILSTLLVSVTSNAFAQIIIDAEFSEDDNEFTDNTYEMEDYSVVTSQNSQLCPTNDCTIEIEDGELSQNMFNSQLYGWDGIMNVGREENGGVRSSVYDLSSSMTVDEKFEKDDVTTLYVSGDLELGDKFDFDIVNGTISLDGKKVFLHLETK